MSEVLVGTHCGPVRGNVDQGVALFCGIPYAAPPVGRRRFAFAQPVEPWSAPCGGTEFSAISYQPPPSPAEFLPADPTEMSEDCLYLNIWAPWSEASGAQGVEAAPKPSVDGLGHPVMLFVHGGGFTSGTGALSLYSGESFARRGVVLVTFNYRLGVLGWLAHPALAGEDGAWANFGLSDQVAALGWVRDNIASFGGDPHNVTVFGESAGAMAVAALLACPAAAGSFRRAIMQSGAAMAIGAASAAELAEEVARAAGGLPLSLEELRAVPVEHLLAAQWSACAKYEGLGLPLQPVVDGSLLPLHPAASVSEGAAGDVDVLIGTNRDEWRFFTYTSPSLRSIDDDRLGRLVARHLELAGLSAEVSAAGFVEAVRTARAARGEPVSPKDLYCAMATDWVFRVPSMRLAECQSKANERTFAYLFDWESPLGDLGSCHALDLPFVFGTVGHPLMALFAGTGPAAEALSEKMQSAWVAFARTGHPSCEAVGDWPAYEPALRATMRLGSVVEVLHEPMEAERAWLSGALGTYGEVESAGLEHVRRVRPER
ncbi:MAG: carboxylesterase/lipase family protein [Acidimicrobiales bacterium]